MNILRNKGKVIFAVISVITLGSAVLIAIILLGKPYTTNNSDSSNTSSLILLHVLFRHGNRTVTTQEVYPKDPYFNETYYPTGRGQLTESGKRLEYELGKTLRKRYNYFLGSYYYPPEVEATSTYIDRAKMSLELVLAALYPPSDIQIWNELLDWQPIPFQYNQNGSDPVLMGWDCPNHHKQYKEYVNTAHMQTEFDKYSKVFNYISDNTGLNVTTFGDILPIYTALRAQQEYGLKLPDWTKKVWPECIISLASKSYLTDTGTKELSQLAAGYFLQKVIADTLSKIDGSTIDKKIYLYSGHEVNLATTLIALGIFGSPHIPDYGSCLTIEVHRMNTSYGVQIFYDDSVKDERKPQILPGCEPLCPLHQFISLMAKHMPPNVDFCYQ